MEGKKDPPPRGVRLLRLRRDGSGRVYGRQRVPDHKKQKLIHELLMALFLALGIAVVGALACCVVRCDGACILMNLDGSIGMRVVRLIVSPQMKRNQPIYHNLSLHSDARLPLPGRVREAEGFGGGGGGH